MRTLALITAPTADGWAIYRTDGREVARFRGLCARRRALRHVARIAAAKIADGR